VTASIWNPGSNIPSGGSSVTRAQESQTIVAGQTVVAFTTLEYLPGTNSLYIFIDGFFFSDYVQTNSTSITLSSSFLFPVNLVAIAGIPLNFGLAGDSVSYIAAGANSVARDIQTKVRETSWISIEDKGALENIDCSTSLQSAINSGFHTEIPPGSWTASSAASIVGNKVLRARAGAVLSGAGLSAAGFFTGAAGAEQQVHYNSSRATDGASFYFRRESNYVGGTPGFVNSGVLIHSFVRNSASTSFEWGLTSTLFNSSNSGENVGIYAQAHKLALGATWALVSEIYDYSASNPTTSVVCAEFDITANGTDDTAPFGARVGLDIVLRNRDPAGAAITASWGVRIQGDTGAVVKRGYSFVPGVSTTYAFDASTATVVSAAFKMDVNQPIIFKADDTKKLFYDGTGLKYETSGTLLVRFNDSGLTQLGVNSTAAGTPASFVANRTIRIQQNDGTILYLPAMLATW